MNYAEFCRLVNEAYQEYLKSNRNEEDFKRFLNKIYSAGEHYEIRGFIFLVRYVVNRFLKSEQFAKDVVQDFFLDKLKHIVDSYKGDPNCFCQYLIRCLINFVIDQIRNSNRLISFDLGEYKERFSIEPSLINLEISIIIDTIIEQKNILALRNIIIFLLMLEDIKIGEEKICEIFENRNVEEMVNYLKEAFQINWEPVKEIIADNKDIFFGSIKKDSFRNLKVRGKVITLRFFSEPKTK